MREIFCLPEVIRPCNVMYAILPRNSFVGIFDGGVAHN